MATVAITYIFLFIFMNYKIKLAEFLLGANILQDASEDTNINILQSSEWLNCYLQNPGNL